MKSRQMTAAKRVVRGLNALLQSPFAEALFTADEIIRLDEARRRLEHAIRVESLDELQRKVQVCDAEE